MSRSMPLLDFLKLSVIASKRAGWEEGRAASIAELSRDYQGAGIEDKAQITSLAARIMALKNPYGEAE